MMGVGKTTIGKRLSRKLKMRFVDIDQIIEKNEKKTIKEIFEIKGESYFRKIEKNTSLNMLKKKKFSYSSRWWSVFELYCKERNNYFFN